MKDPVKIERMKQILTGYSIREHKDHWPIRFFVERYYMRSRKYRKQWAMHTFYFVDSMRRLDKEEKEA